MYAGLSSTSSGLLLFPPSSLLPCCVYTSFMYWLWCTVGLSCGFLTSLDFLSCLTAFCCPCWPPAPCVLLWLGGLCGLEQGFSVSESNVTYQVCYRLLPIRGGDGTDLILFNFRLKLNLKRKLVHGATSQWSVHTSFSALFLYSKCFWQFIGKSGRCWWDQNSLA